MRASQANGLGEQAEPEDSSKEQTAPLPARARVTRWLQEQDPEGVIAAPDQAKQVTYVAETGPWEQFGSRLWLELWERGLGRAVRTGGGGRWVRPALPRLWAASCVCQAST